MLAEGQRPTAKHIPTALPDTFPHWRGSLIAQRKPRENFCPGRCSETSVTREAGAHCTFPYLGQSNPPGCLGLCSAQMWFKYINVFPHSYRTNTTLQRFVPNLFPSQEKKNQAQHSGKTCSSSNGERERIALLIPDHSLPHAGWRQPCLLRPVGLFLPRLKLFSWIFRGANLVLQHYQAPSPNHFYRRTKRTAHHMCLLPYPWNRGGGYSSCCLSWAQSSRDAVSQPV